MTLPQSSLLSSLEQLDTEWPIAYVWAVDHMPGPAYCCSSAGTLVHCTAAALRLWGGLPQNLAGVWDGFHLLRGLDGQVIDKDQSPAARAVSERSPSSVELLAISADDQPRRIVVHTKPVLDSFTNVIGVLCGITDISEKYYLKERLGEAAAARHDFLRMLAHELRNPLAPIINIASLLKHSNVDPKLEKIGKVVERQTNRLARFITDLLDASCINYGHDLAIMPRMCSGKEILDLTLDIVEPVARSRNQHLKIDNDAVETILCCDTERVAQALTCVLLNASAFTTDGKDFYLRITVDDADLRFEVIDSGLGIAPQDLAHVFEPFERRATPPGRVSDGAGLGLTIAKGVCEAHGGTISVRSAGLGYGTTVSMTMPIAENTCQ
jgi:signal transduction histidine kinase